MDRCALFVDAGYVLADGAMAVHGTRRRESVSWDYPGLLQLLAGLAMERSRLPLLRCYWYDSTVEGRRSPDHDALADLPGVKLRLAKMRPGRREGVEGEIHRDLTTLARNKAVSDAMVVSAEEDLAQVIADVQDMGMRVTLLHIANDGNAEIPRALRQECDDIVQISASQLRPFAELISGAEPPRRDEREGGMLAIRAGSNGNGHSNGHGNGHGNGRALLGRVAQHAAERHDEDRADAVREPAAAYDTIADFGSVSDYRPLEEYRPGQDYSAPPSDYGAPAIGAGPSLPDFTPAPAAPAPAPGRPEFTARAEPPARQDSQLRPESPELPPREELYAAPVAVPLAADDLTAERGSARPAQEPEMLRPVESGYGAVEPGYNPVESGYNPGAVREQFQREAAAREPHPGDAGDRYQPVPVPVPAAVPAGSAAIRRLPVHNGAQAGQSAGQPSSGQGPLGPAAAAAAAAAAARWSRRPGPRDRVAGHRPGIGRAAHRPGRADGAGGHGLRRQPRRCLWWPAPGQRADIAGRSAAGPGRARGSDRPGRGTLGSARSARSARSAGPGQAGQQGPDAYPALSQVAPPPGQQDAGGSPGYSGGQSGVSLADAVQSAHEEGQAFGESVARDAPALWLEAVLARKPRMPSDLEARLLQGSALPIDFLLHDEVRHALRRGFWDALEHARR